jgi:arginyl-tRNA synthetase
MNVYFVAYNEIISVLQSADMVSNDLNLDSITVDVPTEGGHGEITTNAAMVLVKFLKQSPRDIAVKIKELLEKNSKLFKTIEIAGPGFINCTLKEEFWYKELANIAISNNNYGQLDLGKGKKVNLEFASPNPTGPMHIGHSRGAIYGDVLASLLKFVGYDVTKEFYINDAGNQINVLADSVFFRYQELHGHDMGELPTGCYPGEYVIDAAKALKVQYEDKLLDMGVDERQKKIRNFAIEAMMKLIRDDLDLLGVRHDVLFYETTLHKENKIAEIVKFLEKKDLVYTGVLEKPKGHESEDWDNREQLLFRATQYGDDTDRALKKSDGSWTYFAADMAYLRNKLDRGFENLIMVLGADHIGFIKRMKALCAALNNEDDTMLDIKICQLVNFLKDNTPLKMSKRAGVFIGVKDVVEMVSKDIIRFMMLIKKNTHPIDFDVEKVVEQSKDNPVFYVQYANARASSVLRSIKEIDGNFIKNIKHNISNVDLSLLNSQKELSLIRTLSYWPKIVERAAIAHDPHRIVSFLQDVAVLFHSLWTHAKEDVHFKFIQEDNLQLTQARAVLAYTTLVVISSGLGIIGVEPVSKM